MLLSGAGRLTDGYEVVGEHEAEGLAWIELAPRAAEGDFRRVRLAFAGGELRRMELADALDQVTRIEFTELERNPALADALFAFVPPPGTDVVGDAPPAGPAP
jgi:outer membrane lipoprotein-sorting protein